MADRYDVMNDVMSGGLHRLWKRHLVQNITLYNTMQILDLAGGPGDIAFRLYEKAQRQPVSVASTVADINKAMLDTGRARALDKGILDGMRWQETDAEALPFTDGSFDVCTMTFGIRNVTDRQRALSDIFRVLTPGGLFACMEFTQVDNLSLRKLYDAYSFKVIPALGEKITQDREAYQYLVESIRQFPSREAFAGMMEAAGFAHVGTEALTQGVVTIFTGRKL